MSHQVPAEIANTNSTDTMNPTMPDRRSQTSATNDDVLIASSNNFTTTTTPPNPSAKTIAITALLQTHNPILPTTSQFTIFPDKFSTLIRQLIADINPELECEEGAFQTLQEYAEWFLISWFQYANTAAKLSGRVTIKPTDLQVTSPYSTIWKDILDPENLVNGDYNEGAEEGVKEGGYGEGFSGVDSIEVEREGDEDEDSMDVEMGSSVEEMEE
ncbi:MAG: hypothetical protein M1834_002220 [Cirrosporium novae-zelandiae]|nr:MAG: hypothetical protein M1834_002220 [Cirrosporium novae-zelandiae]